MSKQPDEVVCPFGKHKGKTVGEIPLDYIAWLVNKNLEEFKFKAALYIYYSKNKEIIEDARTKADEEWNASRQPQQTGFQEQIEVGGEQVKVDVKPSTEEAATEFDQDEMPF